MIRFYAYYNVGGFKDLYLGDSSQEKEFCYYLPLLPVYKSRLEMQTEDTPANAELRMRILQLEELPHIEELHTDSPIGFTTQVGNAITHGGYALMLQQLDNGEYMIIIRDILGALDDFKRPAPFHLILLASPQMASSMEILAERIRCSLTQFKEKVSQLFSYDYTKNGLRCNFRTLNNYVLELLESTTNEQEVQPSIVVNTDTETSKDTSPGTTQPIHLLVLEQKKLLTTVLEELRLTEKDIAKLYLTNGEQITLTEAPSNREDSTTLNEALSMKRIDIKKIIRDIFNLNEN